MSRGGPLRRSPLTSLRTILRSAAAALGVERAAHEALIVEMWPEIAGADAAAHSRPAGLRGTTLLVDAEPGLWVQELSARRGRFTEEINRRLGGGVVSDIRIRSRTGAAVEGAPADAGRVADDEATLSADELAMIDRAAAEIGDPELRETARRVMASQLRWRKQRMNSNQ